MKVSKMILAVVSWLFFTTTAFGQENLVKEDFATSIAHKWTVSKAELNGKELPADVFGDFSVTYHAEGTYDVVKKNDAFSGTWRYSEETKVMITNDKEGIERLKILHNKDDKLIIEALHRNGTIKLELVKAK